MLKTTHFATTALLFDDGRVLTEGSSPVTFQFSSGPFIHSMTVSAVLSHCSAA